jgi:hypothetical protein
LKEEERCSSTFLSIQAIIDLLIYDNFLSENKETFLEKLDKSESSS